MVGEAVEQGACEALGTEDLGPLMKGNIAGNQRGGAFVTLADEFEQQLGACLRQWHETQFVDDQQLVGGQLFLEAAQLFFVPCLDQLADQGGGRGETNTMSALTG